MITGETVTVERSEIVGRNAHNQPIREWVAQPVDNVLVSPGPRSDIPDTARPDGVVVAWTLHFPKTFVGDLRGARIAVRGGTPCRVIGDPQPYTLENTPTSWWMPVEVERADG